MFFNVNVEKHGKACMHGYTRLALNYVCDCNLSVITNNPTTVTSTVDVSHVKS